MTSIFQSPEPAMKTSHSPRRVILLLVGVGLGWYVLTAILQSGVGGGQGLNSPDGKFHISVWRLMRDSTTDPYTIKLEVAGTHEEIRRFSIHPVKGRPKQPARGADRIIEWSPDSSFAEITLDHEKVLRVFVPDQSDLTLSRKP